MGLETCAGCKVKPATFGTLCTSCRTGGRPKGPVRCHCAERNHDALGECRTCRRLDLRSLTPA